MRPNIGRTILGGLFGTLAISRDGQKIKTITGLVDHDDLAKAVEGQL